MKIDTKNNRSITFKESVSLEQFSQAMKHFEKMFKLLSGRTAMYTDFTDWLVTQDFVEVGLSDAEIAEKVKRKVTEDESK